MSRSIKLYLEDIVSSCTKILDYTQGMNFEEFVADAGTFDAVILNLLIIGEAVKMFPKICVIHILKWNGVKLLV